MNLDKLMDIMRERQYTLELDYTNGVWEMIVWDSNGDEVASRKIDDNRLLVKPAIAKAALDIVKQLT